MNISHDDPYYAPRSLVGLVRAERVKFLLGSNHPSHGLWKRAERVDPSADTVVDPAREAEGAQLLLDYYEAVRRDRRVRGLVFALAFLGAMGLVVGGALASNPLVALIGVGLGVLITYAISVGSIRLPGKTGHAKNVFEESGHFRDRGVLDGYLITINNPDVIWEAIDLERRRQSISYEAAFLSAHPLLSTHREAEKAQLEAREQELRQQIVDMLDPQRPEAERGAGNLRDNFDARIRFDRLSPGAAQTMLSHEGSEQR